MKKSLAHLIRHKLISNISFRSLKNYSLEPSRTSDEYYKINIARVLLCFGLSVFFEVSTFQRAFAQSASAKNKTTLATSSESAPGNLKTMVDADATDPNIILSFKKFYIDIVQDNVDGAFSDVIKESYAEVLSKNLRFETVGSKSSSDVYVQCKVEKKSERIDYELSLYLNPTHELFYSISESVPKMAEGEELKTAIKRTFKALLKRIPFYGTVTGKEADQLTFDIGYDNGLKEGDVVQVSRVSKIKRHPLTKQILDVEMTYVGSVIIEVVEPTISFGSIQKIVDNENIGRTYKVTGIEVKEDRPAQEEAVRSGSERRSKKIELEKDSAEFGSISVGPYLGSFSNSTSQNNGAVVVSGSGMNFGAGIDGDIWITKNWTANLGLAYGTSSMTMQNEKTAAKSGNVSSTMQGFDIGVGYRHFLWKSFYGPKVYAKLGYSSFTWKPSSDSAFILGNRSYSGINLSLGGSIPIISKYHQLLMGLGLGLGTSYTQTTTNVSPDDTQSSDASATRFYFGYQNDFLPNMAFKVCMMFNVYSVSYIQGVSSIGESNSSQKQIAVAPSLVYYF